MRYLLLLATLCFSLALAKPFYNENYENDRMDDSESEEVFRKEVKKSPYGDPEYAAWALAAAMGKRDNMEDMLQKRGQRYKEYQKKSPYGDPEYAAWALAAAMGKRDNVEDTPERRGERYNMYRKKSPFSNSDPAYQLIG